MEKIRVMLADDNQIFRDALAMFLASDADMEVVAQVEDGHDVLAKLDAMRAIRSIVQSSAGRSRTESSSVASRLLGLRGTGRSIN